MAVYYNENDPKAAAWLRELSAQGLIAEGIVDERSITDVRPADLLGFRQCHFFAGIGVWSYALRSAGWPDERPVWTGSCPCQPFSAAGKGGGFADERHLWPAWHHLVSQCRPRAVFGEQVASKDGLAWLDLVHTDMEAEGYAFGALDLCAAGVGAPHIRQRLYFAADARRQAARQHECGSPLQPARPEQSGVAGGLADALHTERWAQHVNRQDGRDGQDRRWPEAHSVIGSRGKIRGLANANNARSQGWGVLPECAGERLAWAGGVESGLADANGGNAGAEGLQRGGQYRQRAQDSGAGGVADAGCERRQQDTGSAPCDETQDGRARWHGSAQVADHIAASHGENIRPGPVNGFWRAADWIGCTDDKWRAVEPGTFPLAHGAPARVGRLRGYGNAIVAPLATAFIEAYMETRYAS